jgi:hypothetical protein
MPRGRRGRDDHRTENAAGKELKWTAIGLSEMGALCPSGFANGPVFRRDAGALKRDSPHYPDRLLAQRWRLRCPRTDIVRDALLVAEPLETVSETV